MVIKVSKSLIFVECFRTRSMSFNSVLPNLKILTNNVTLFDTLELLIATSVLMLVYFITS